MAGQDLDSVHVRVLNPPKPPVLVHYEWTTDQKQVLKILLGKEEGHYVQVGPRRTGKSTTLREVIRQDIKEFGIVPIVIRLTLLSDLVDVAEGLDESHVLSTTFGTDPQDVANWLEEQMQSLKDSKVVIYADECIRSISPILGKYKCSKSVVRGKEFHIGIIDEGCFGNPRILKENMLPVWLMKGRVIVGISSPKGKSNYFAKLFFAKYPGTERPIFNTLIFDGACNKCKEEGKEDTCGHEPWRYPSWLSTNTKMEAIRLSMDTDAETFNREQKGIITEDSQGTYVQFKFVEAMKKNPWFEWDNAPQPDWCVVAVDPNVGGSIQPDETAFIALVACRGQIVCVGMEAHPTESPPQIASLFSLFINKLYNHPWLKKSIFVLFVERNIAAGPYAIERVMESKQRKYIITDPIRDVSGWWTTYDVKSKYVVTGASEIRQNRLVFMKDFVCENPWLPHDTKREITLNKLLEQLPRFRLKPASQVSSSRRLPLITGKLDENGKMVKGAKDDLAFICFAGIFFVVNIGAETIPGLNYRFIKQEGSIQSKANNMY